METTCAPDYVPLALRRLRRDLPMSCDLYVDQGGSYVLYKESSLPFTRDDWDRLVSSGTNEIWVQVLAEGSKGAGQRLTTILALPDEQLPPRVKAQVWYGSAVAIAQRSVASTVLRDTIGDVHSLVDATVNYLASSRLAFHVMLSATMHDYSVYTHAVNVAVYALGLGTSIGLRYGELRDLGMAAFLHDIGKTRVAREVLNKPGPLTEEEWTVMRQHPIWGEEILSTMVDLPPEVLAIVSQHHERLDGMGYPRGLGANGLHRFSTIVSLVDAFDAMTSNRCYSPARTPYTALGLLKSEVGEKFDQELFASLVLLLGDPRRIGHA